MSFHGVEDNQASKKAETSMPGKSSTKSPNQNKDTLTINAKFAKSFEIRKRREDIQKAKEKAKDLNIYSGSDVSSSESEDSDAELLTKKADSKFLKVLSMIKTNDPKLKDPSYKAFSDSDFESSEDNDKKPDKPMRYKELVTQSITKVSKEPIKDTPAYEEKVIKNEFLDAVQKWQATDKEDSLFVERKKNVNEPEKPELSEAIKDYVEDTQELEALKSYWAKPKNDDDLFLKKFMLHKLWEEPEDKLMTYDEIVDEEDQVKTNEAEKFETAYNFRYEEEGFEKLKSK